jgi:hypothetical protein
MQFNRQGYMQLQQQPMYPNYAYPSPYGMEQINYNPMPAMPGMPPQQMIPANYSMPTINYAGSQSTHTAILAPLPSASKV